MWTAVEGQTQVSSVVHLNTVILPCVGCRKRATPLTSTDTDTGQSNGVFVYPKGAQMDNELEYGLAELHQAEILYAYLVAQKENSNGTPAGRKWAIAVTDCEKLMAWITYVATSR